eukprot:GFUD01043023.1.p1 GENE.GFUD01043023.1~~GFUD01043023.1.p1  ORF type:complete len:333 (-),score=125.78 GFUD01043023.1:64-1062(-)
MFPKSTQSQFWMFENEAALTVVKAKTNQAYTDSHVKEAPPEAAQEHFLSEQDESDVVFYFSVKMGEFCEKFKPPMPRYVKGTAFHYFKRFYLYNSVMNYHPKEILVTAVYLACKVEEFNVSMQQFVANVQGNQERATKIILNNELLLMQELQFHLTVHNPFRAVEGFLIDIKTRCDSVHSVDSFRPEIESFLDSVFLTEACMIYAPSQIALAAIIHAASRQKQNLDSYVTESLFGEQGEEAILHIITCVRNIRVMVKNIPEPTPNIKLLCTRLEQCRNQDNNPDSLAYKRKIEEVVDEDDLLQDYIPPPKQARLDSDSGDSSGVRALSPRDC